MHNKQLHPKFYKLVVLRCRLGSTLPQYNHLIKSEWTGR